MPTPAGRKVEEADRRRLAVLCDADPRSVDKVLRGERVRGLAGHRIRAVLEAAGIPLPKPIAPRQADVMATEKVTP